MAKKQTRRSISVSRTTYERLKAFCETNNISMSQLVETRVNDFLGTGDPSSLAGVPVMTAVPAITPIAPRPFVPRPVSAVSSVPAMSSVMPSSQSSPIAKAVESRLQPAPATAAVTAYATAPGAVPPPVAPTAAPMTSAAARFAVDPPPPIIKPRQDTAAPKPAEKRPDQIFTF